MLPDFIIIGAQKSASSFLQTCLRDHPEVYMPESETPFFESPDYENGNIHELERIFQERKEKRLGIKRPTYFARPEVAKRIETVLPYGKLIVVLRNPLDRALSAYYHYVTNGFIPPMAFEKGMRRILTDTAFGKKYRRSDEIIEFGFYFKHLKRYSYFLERNQMLILLHEDIVANPLESVRKAYDFLDVDSEFSPASLTSRPQKVVYNLPRLRFLWLRTRFMYDYNQDRTRLVVKNQDLIDKLFYKILTFIDEQIVARVFSDKKPEISSGLRKSMYEIYKTDIEALESLIMRDLSGWKLS